MSKANIVCCGCVLENECRIEIVSVGFQGALLDDLKYTIAASLIALIYEGPIDLVRTELSIVLVLDLNLL